MSRPRPLVSVVIPSYNHERFVERSIRSVLEQSYSPIELVVVDDGSTDGSWEVIERVRSETGNAFEAYRKANGGVSSALNFGIERTSGEYVAVLASDDYFLTEKVERQMKLFLRSRPDVGIVHCSAYQDYGDGDLVDMTGSYPAAQGKCFEGLLMRKVVAIAPSVIFARSVYNEIGGFDESLTAEDIDFHTRVAAAGYSFAYLPEPLMVKRATGQNLSAMVAANHEAHLATLHKFRGRLDDRQYRQSYVQIMVSRGRAAAANGNTRLAYESFREASRYADSVRPYLGFVLSVGRHRLLAALPGRDRQRLRRVRAALRANRFR